MKNIIKCLFGIFKKDVKSHTIITNNEPTTFTLNGITYPIYKTSNNNFYIQRRSQHDTVYRYVIPKKYINEFYEWGITSYINKPENND